VIGSHRPLQASPTLDITPNDACNQPPRFNPNRTRQRDGCIGRCASTKQQLSLDFEQRDEAGEWRDDAALQQLVMAVAGGR